MTDLPSGTVTFLFTDVEGSTRLLKALGRERYARVLADHEHLLRASFAAADGQEIDTQGDAFFAVFRSAGNAIRAAEASQRALAGHSWPEAADVRVRMGIHTGEPAIGTNRYVGLGVHRAARICAAGHGGQVLLSKTTHDLLEDEEPLSSGFRDLGPQRLKDLDRPERIYQLIIPGLPSDFPPLKTLEAQPTEAGMEALEGRSPVGVRPGYDSASMSRTVLCQFCDTNLGVVFEREAGERESLDFLPNDDCWHVTREQLVEDIEALYAGESSLPISLRRIAVRARQVSH